MTPLKQSSPVQSHHHHHQAYPHELTTREVEVLRLVAQGLSDSGVAERLVISPRTVQGHVRSIFNKIQRQLAQCRHPLRHRTQARLNALASCRMIPAMN